MKTNQTDAELIESAKQLVYGTDFKVVVKSEWLINDRGKTSYQSFRAVEFTTATGERHFISEMFL